MSTEFDRFIKIKYDRGGMKIVIIYVLVGALWILFSDRLTGLISTSAEMQTRISMFKGWGYVLVTGIMLYFLIQRNSLSLMEVSRKYVLLAENISDVVWVVDLTTSHFIYVSPSIKQLRGLLPEQALLESMQDAITPASWDHLSAVLPARIDEFRQGQKKTYTDILEQYRADGTTVWVEVTSRFVINQENSHLEVYGTSRDITDRKRAEKEIEFQMQRLQALRTIDLSIIGSFDMKLSLRVILDHLLPLLDVDAADILQIDPYTQALSFVDGRGFHSPTNVIADLKHRHGLAERAIFEKTVQHHIPNLALAGGEFIDHKLLSNEGFVSYYAVPLIAKGDTVGVIEVFARKPLQTDANWLEFLETLAGLAAISIENNRLFDGLQRANMNLLIAYDSTIEGWSKAIDLRDMEAEGHTRRAVELSLRLASLAGVTSEELLHLRRGALLHDIGNIGVPEAILFKPGPLTDEEWMHVRKHPGYAFELLSGISYLRSALDIPYCHHERWDGGGYPRGLVGEQIPYIARLFSIVDVWDALMSDRPYRRAWTRKDALDYIRSESGKFFDPKVVELFLQMVKVES